MVKRYVQEETQEVDRLFDSAYRGSAVLATSALNLGEASSVLDRKARRGELSSDVKAAVSLMLREVRTLARLGSFVVVPLVGKVMRESIAVVLRHHVYVVDALQVASCKYVNCEAFYTADKELAEIAEAEDVASVLLGRRPPSRASPRSPVVAPGSPHGEASRAVDRREGAGATCGRRRRGPARRLAV